VIWLYLSRVGLLYVFLLGLIFCFWGLGGYGGAVGPLFLGGSVGSGFVEAVLRILVV